MLRAIFWSILICSLVSLAESQHEEDYRGNDIFDIVDIDPYDLKAGSTIQMLDNLLIDRTKSSDSDENLDIVLEELKADYRNNVSERKPIQLKRLLLALRALNGEHQCDYYSYLILSKSLTAIGFNVELSRRKEHKLRRIDGIVYHFMYLHVDQCRQVYFEKFDMISKNLEQITMKRFDLLFEDAIKEITSDARKKNVGLTYVERLFNAVSGKTSMTFSFELRDIYKALEKLARGDPDEEFIRPVESRETGLISIRRDKFAKLYDEYILKTCNYVTKELGQDIFNPAYLDMEIDPHLEVNRVDFYETWLKYILCYRHGGFKARFDSLVVLAEKQARSASQ